MMDRRTFLGTLTGGFLAAPLAAETFDPNKAEEVRQMQAPGRTLGITLEPVEAGEAGAFERAVADAVRAQADALIVLPDLSRFWSVGRSPSWPRSTGCRPCTASRNSWGPAA